MRTLGKKLLAAVIAAVLATAIWVPCLHLLFAHGPEEFHSKEGVSREAGQLAKFKGSRQTST